MTAPETPPISDVLDLENVAVCDRCGAVVTNELTHDIWHENLDDRIQDFFALIRGES